jgi:hypothetical protein
MNTTQVYLQEEYAKTEIAKLLNLLDEEELVGLAPVKHEFVRLQLCY